MHMIWVSSPQTQKSSGFLSLILGILILLFSPFIASLVGVFLSSLVLIISIILLVFGMMMQGTGLRILLLVIGLIGSFFGLSALLSPGIAVSALGIILGIWMILLGLGQLILISAFSSSRLYYLFTLLAGILTVVIGLYLILSPVQGMQIMVVFLGCYLVAYGILSLLRPVYSY